MQFPTLLRSHIARPIITLHLEASNGMRVCSDVLVDTGADVTLMPVDLADSLNIDLTQLPEVTVTRSRTFGSFVRVISGSHGRSGVLG